MTIQEYVPLASLTTLKVGGNARAVAQVSNEAELREALEFARANALSFYVLGEGSNVLAHDDGYDGLIIRMGMRGVTYDEAEQDTVRVHVAAGENWDALVREVAARGLWGFENLAGIPGTVGAAPVQNIGAYGADIAQTLESVEAYDAGTDTVHTFSKEDCQLGYRDSRFKHEPNLIIVRVHFVLTRVPSPRIEYGDLLAAKEQGTDLTTPEAIGNVVRAIRNKKFPDLSVSGTAGSFFKNPVLSPEAYAALEREYGAVPRFPHPHGIKVPLAFILDRILALRGFRLGNASLFGAQPLVLVLDAGGTAREIEALAQHVETLVKEKTNISIEREVRSLPKK